MLVIHYIEHVDHSLAGGVAQSGLQFVDRISCHGAKWQAEQQLRRSSCVARGGVEGEVSAADDEFLNGSREVRRAALR